MELLLADNGVGIEKEDLKHILNGSISVTKDGLTKEAVFIQLPFHNIYASKPPNRYNYFCLKTQQKSKLQFWAD